MIPSFSSRLTWGELHTNRLYRVLEQRRALGAPILDLTESNPTRAGLDYPATLLNPFTDCRSLLYEPTATGARTAREAVAGTYSARGIDVLADNVVLTASSSEAYAWLFKLLADPGDEVLVPRPSYPLFEFLASLESVRIVPYPVAYHGYWGIDVDELERAASARTRAVVVVNPNNPTGSYLKADELAGMAKFCAARGLALISDEVFSEYPLKPDPRRVESVASQHEVLSFAVGGLSKSAGLPQMKLGWILVSGPPPDREAALSRLELIADTYLSVGTPVQHAAPALLEAGVAVRDQIRRRTRANLDALRSAVTASPACELLDVEGGWYAVLRVPRTRSEEEWAIELLEREGVLVQPGFFYDFASEAFLVLSLLTPPEMFAEGVRRVLARAE